MIKLRDVSFQFPGAARPILGPVSLTIENGAWVAVAGGNGSGKTTLCRLLAGLSPATSGAIEIDGVDPATPRRGVSTGARRGGGHPLDLRAVAIAFQNPDSQFVTSSVEREICFGMENLGFPAGEQASRCDAAAGVFRLGRYIGRNPHTLSGGEKQRLLLACLWAMSPRHLVLDEPFSFLDAEGKKSFLEVLRRSFRNEVRTIVWSTIDRDEASLADRVMYLHEGRIVYDGPPGGCGDALARSTIENSLVRREASAAATPSAPAGEPAREARDRPNPLIEMRDASLSPGGDFSLRVPYFSVAPGESIGICGPSGCGKTTLLLGCAGLLLPRAGEVTMFGKRVSSRRDFPAGRVAFLFQTPEEGFFAPTVGEEVALALRGAGDASRRNEAVSRTLSEVGLDPARFLDRSPYHLSQGEKRLVALASVLVMGAPVMMLDEPTIFLDEPARRRLRQALERIRAAGASIVIASHDEAFIGSFAHRVVSLGNGIVV